MSGSRDAANAAISAALTAVVTSIAASQSAGCETRRARRAPAADPSAIPPMKDAAVVANAYVVGPMTSTRSRAKATSYTSAENPDSAAAVQASAGRGVDATFGG